MRSQDAGFSPDETPMKQVRELLFGAQLKEIETHLQRQEDRLRQEVADVKDTLKNRFDFLENFMKSETASLLSRFNADKAERDNVFKDSKRESDAAIKQEQRERGEALSQIAKELALAEETFERKLTGLSNTLDGVERELRQLLLTESRNLSATAEEKHQQVLDAMRRTAEQIRQDMVHRSALAGLLTETAIKLSAPRPAESGAAKDDVLAEPASADKAGKAKAPAKGPQHD